MTYFPKKTKETIIETVVKICLKKINETHEKEKFEMTAKTGFYGVDLVSTRKTDEEKTRSELINIMEEKLKKEEKDMLLEIAVSNQGLDSKFWNTTESLDKETFFRGFYYKVLPMVLDEDYFNDVIKEIYETAKKLKKNVTIETKVNFVSVRDRLRVNFLNYFILRDNFAEKRCKISSPSSAYVIKVSNDEQKGMDDFNNVSEMYKFAALIMHYSPEKSRNCLLDISTSLFHDTYFLKIALEKKILVPASYLDALDQLAEKDSMWKIVAFPNLRDDVKKKIAETILFNENVKEFFRNDKTCDYHYNKILSESIPVLEPEYDMMCVPLIAANSLKYERAKEKHDKDLFDELHYRNFSDSIKNYCKLPCFNDDRKFKAEHQLLTTFLHGYFEMECYKKLPKFFQEMVIIKHLMSIYRNAKNLSGAKIDKKYYWNVEVLSEFGINKEEFKKEIDIFFADLKKIAKNGRKPSDYYAGEPFESGNIANSKSYLTSLVFQTAVSLLADNFGAWKAVRPMLAIFRNLKEQAYSIDMKYYEYGRYSWSFVPVRLIQFLGSLEDEESETVSEAWFDHLAKQLSSADEIEVKKREEKPETVPEEFKEGYDIKVVEAHPLWREAYCKAAEELGIHPVFDKYKVFNYLKKNDIDASVREAAEDTLKSIEKIKGKFDSGSRKRALLNAWWCYRIAHLISLGLNVDGNDAEELKSIEVTVNYPKNFKTPEIQPVKKQSWI